MGEHAAEDRGVLGSNPSGPRAFLGKKSSQKKGWRKKAKAWGNFPRLFQRFQRLFPRICVSKGFFMLTRNRVVPLMKHYAAEKR